MGCLPMAFRMVGGRGWSRHPKSDGHAHLLDFLLLVYFLNLWNQGVHRFAPFPINL